MKSINVGFGQKRHRARIENRISVIPGLNAPGWEVVISRHNEPWDREHLQLDTANLSPHCIDNILTASIQ